MTGIPIESLVRLLDGLVGFDKLREDGTNADLLRELAEGRGTARISIDLDAQNVATLWRLASGERVAIPDALSALFASFAKPPDGS